MTERMSTLPPIPEAYDWELFRRNGHKLIDFIADYHLSLQREEAVVTSKAEAPIPVLPLVKPGFLTNVLPDVAPEEAESWDAILADVSKYVLPGVTHWQHPRFYAYFPAMISPAALLGDALSTAFNNPGFSWICCPSATELEVVVTNWLVDAFALPKTRFGWSGSGGCVLQPSATEAMVVVLLGAQNRILHRLIGEGSPFDPEFSAKRSTILPKLAMYYSDQAHFCVEKAARILSICNVRKICSDENGTMSMMSLAEALQGDVNRGLCPFFISANFGATGICAIDDLPAIATLAQRFDAWFNIDGAYAGVTAICPEVRPRLSGVEHCDSFIVNGSKWFSMSFNSSFLFFSDKKSIVASLNSTGVYLDNKHSSENSVVDFKDYHLGLGRPFRSLKVFATLKAFGMSGIRATIRRHMILAKVLHGLLSACTWEAMQLNDIRGEGRVFTVLPTEFGLVCFKVVGFDDVQNLLLLQRLNEERDMHMVHTKLPKGGVFLRISLAYPRLDLPAMHQIAEAIGQELRKMLLQ